MTQGKELNSFCKLSIKAEITEQTEITEETEKDFRLRLTFRLFRYFRLFRNLSYVFASSLTSSNPHHRRQNGRHYFFGSVIHRENISATNGKCATGFIHASSGN